MTPTPMKHLFQLLALAAVASACQTPGRDAPATDVPPDVFQGATAPGVASGADGGAVAWVEADGADRRLLVRADGAEAPVEVARGAVSAHSQAGPRLGDGPDGAFYVAFVEERPVKGRRFAASVLKLARSGDGGRTWEAPTSVHPDPGFPTGHTFHNLAVGPDGVVYVAWLDGTAKDRYRIEHAETAARRDAAALPIRLAHDAEEHGGDKHGHHGAADEPGTDLAVARSTDGGRTFSAPVVVASGTCECCRTALAVGGDGAVYVAWRHVFPGTERDIAVARSGDGGRTWTEPARVHDDGWAIEGCPHAGPALTAGAGGEVTVAWPTGADGRAGTWWTSSSDGGQTFGRAEPLLARAPFGQVAVARDGEDRLWLAWEDPRRAEILVYHPGSADTVRVAGSAPALAGTASGWRLAWETEGGMRVGTGP